MKRLGHAQTVARSLSVRLGDDIEAQLIDWIAKQPAPQPTLSQAIRRLIEQALTGKPAVDVTQPGRKSARTVGKRKSGTEIVGQKGGSLFGPSPAVEKSVAKAEGFAETALPPKESSQ